jgi:lactate dehydrogenase-like 2-hydroxyacid dehydrogenase
MIVTAGIGSDHTDLQAAMNRGITVAEVTYCNSNSVAEHVVMQILSLVRNYIPSYNWVIKGGWNIADCVSRSYDLEGMHVGTVAAGRIGLRVLRLLKPFDCTFTTWIVIAYRQGRERAQSYASHQCRKSGQGLRCGNVELPAASRNRAHDQRENA